MVNPRDIAGNAEEELPAPAHTTNRFSSACTALSGAWSYTGSVLGLGKPGAGIMEADDRQVTTVFTVQPSFHHRHSTNRVSWSVTIVGERAVTPHLVVRRRWPHFMILGLSGADGGITVGLWKLSSLDGRRPPWYRPLVSRYQCAETGWDSKFNVQYLSHRCNTCSCPPGARVHERHGIEKSTRNPNRFSSYCTARRRELQGWFCCWWLGKPGATVSVCWDWMR